MIPKPLTDSVSVKTKVREKLADFSKIIFLRL